MRALIAALAVAASAQPAAPSRAVCVDVNVTDGRGRTVENLKPADFDLLEDGTPQSIDEARFVKIDKGGAAVDPPRQVQSDADERTEASRPNKDIPQSSSCNIAKDWNGLSEYF